MTATAAADGNDRSRCAVDDRRPDLGARNRATEACPADDRGRAAENLKRALDAEVLAQNDIRIEHRDESIEITAARGREEGIDHLALTRQVGIGSGDLGALDPAPGPAGELSRRLGRPIDHRRDLVERQLEHVMEDEGEPFGGGQRVEHDEKGQPDRVREQCLFLGLSRAVLADDGVGQVLLEELLAASVARAEHVQANARHDRRQPAVHVVDVVRPGPVDPQPGVLQGVVGLGDRAEHPVGHRPQSWSLLLEPVCQPLAVVHRSRPRVARCQGSDTTYTANVTKE